MIVGPICFLLEEAAGMAKSPVPEAEEVIPAGYIFLQILLLVNRVNL